MTITGNSAYIVDGADSIIARYTQENNRVFYKWNGGQAVRVCIYPSSTGYSGPVLLSPIGSATGFYIMFNGSKLGTQVYTTIDIDGITWCVSAPDVWCLGNNCRNIDGYPEIDGRAYIHVFEFQTSDPNYYTELEAFVREVLTAGNIKLSYESNGGGATHIAKVTGQLKDLSSNLSDILMVSGGGGGGLIVGEISYTGKEAGGISGSGDNSADQSTGNAFGLGESGTNLSGGGSGLYGGYKGTSAKSGGAGSGYIGNSLLSNKKMVGYNVPTSSSADTKTESVEVFDSNYVANKPKVGNGHARIKFLREPGRKVQTLIDSSQGIKDSIFDNIVTIPNNDYGNDTWQFDQNGVLFINERNSNRASINAKFLKGNATKLYIETSYEHRNTYGSNYRWQFVFLDNLYEGQHTPPSFLARTYFVLHTNQYNIIDNDPWYDLPSTVIELSLNDIPANQRFYISFTSCDGHTEITKIYFDDDAYILE